MKIYKTLRKRGLAMFMALIMCLSLIPTTAFAAEETDHVHNEDGWVCTQAEPVRELTCDHEHTEDCYVPGDPVLICEDSHHTEDCYAPGEDVLTCQEDHEHTEDCYVPGEPVLICSEDAHHTEDCYAPGESVLDCKHEHGDECYTVTEGAWTCVNAVQEFLDAAAELPKAEDVTAENAAGAGEQAGAVLDLYNDLYDARPDYCEREDVIEAKAAIDALQAAAAAALEGGSEDEVPAEVKAFLDAVAELPAVEDIDADNAEAIGELVNDVLDMYEALIDAGFGERDDVTEALETVYAVYEAVLTAEEIEESVTYAASSITKSAFENAYNLGQSDTCYGIIKLGEGSVTDSGTPNVWPTGNWEGAVDVTGYNWVHIYNSNPSVATATYRYDGGKLYITFTPGTSSGTTKISVGVDAKYPHYSLGTFNMELNFDYTVTNVNGTPAGSDNYATLNRSVVYDLSTGKATWGKDPYDNQYGERTSGSSSCIFEFKDPWRYWYSFYPTKATNISVGSYDTSIAAVETYGFTTTHTWSERDDDDNTTHAWTGFKVTGLKAGETVVDITTEYDVQSIRWNNYGTVWSVDDNRSVVTRLYIKVVGEKTNTDYELTYDANGGKFGTGEKALETVTQKQSSPEFTVISQEPALSGYTFLGWADTDDATMVTYKAGNKITLTKETSPKTIYAVWEKSPTVTKVASDKTPNVGEEFKYTITVNNPTSSAISVTITDKLNEKLDVVWDDEYEVYGVSDNGTYDPATRTVTWTNVNVPANGSKYVTVTVTGNAAGTVVNEAQVTLPDGTTKGANDGSGVTITAKPTTYTLVHEYYTSGQPDGHTKQENISGKNVGDIVKVADIKKILKYQSKEGYTYTRANKGESANNPNGYTLGNVITELTLAESGNIIVLRYDRTTDSTYTVQWLDADHNGVELKSETRTGTVGQPVSVKEADKSYGLLVYAGDNYPGTVLSTTLAKSGTVLKMYFTKNVKPNPPTADEVNKEVSGDPNGKTGAVDVYCQPERHKVGHFSAQVKNGRITIGEVVSDSTGGYTCDVTFFAQKFCDAYNTLKETTTDETKHTLVSGQNDVTLKFVWDAENKAWKAPANFEGPLKFYVECPTPAAYNLVVDKTMEESKNAAGDDIVTYKVTVENKSNVSLYNLMLVDTMDKTLEPTSKMDGVQVKVTGNDENTVVTFMGARDNVKAPQRDNAGHIVWNDQGGLTRLTDGEDKWDFTWTLSGEFKPGATVTLTYSAKIIYPENADTVEYYNYADAIAGTDVKDVPQYDGGSKRSTRDFVGGGSGSVGGGSGAVGGQKVKYTLTYDFDGGTWNSNSSYTVEQWSTTGSYTFKVDGTVQPTKDSCTFQNQWTQTGTTLIAGANVVATTENKHVTIYAVWKANPVVTFDPNGGGWGGSTNNKTVPTDTDGKVTPPADPEQTNKVFDGWYTEKTGGDKVDFGEKIFEKDATVYAHWEDDNWKDPNNDKNGVKPGDGIPDKYQVKIVYTANANGNIASGAKTEEVFTLGTAPNYATSGDVTISGSTAEANSRCYFKDWTSTRSVYTNLDKEDASLAGKKLTVLGGTTYTFTANFEAKIELKIKNVGNGETVTYDGKEHTVTGYTMTVWDKDDKEITLPAGLTVTPASEDCVVKGKEVQKGLYTMGLHVDNFQLTGPEAYKYYVSDWTVIDGWLKINPPETVLDVTAGNVETTYDGQEHPVTPGVTVDGTPVDDATVIITYVDGNGQPITGAPKDAGTYTATIIATRGDKSDSATATVTILKRSLTVTTDSASKTYDGAALTAPGRIDGLVDGEAAFTVTGAQTEVGSSENSYTLTWTTGKASNYNISEHIGTLTVTDSNTPYTITVKYVDENGAAIASDAALTTIGEYDVRSLQIPVTGYTFKEADHPLTGTVTENTIITLTYTKDADPTVRTIWVDCVDEEGNLLRRVEVPDVPVTDTQFTLTGEQAPAVLNDGGNRYIRTDSRGTVLIPENGIITVRYALDNWNVDGGSLTGGDGIPDSRQVVVNYRSNDPDYGTVANERQMFTLAGGQTSVDLRNTASTTTLSRTYFINWTEDAALSRDEDLRTAFPVVGGQTYTVTANFGRRAAGGGTGGGGTGGGTTTTPPTTTIPDTTTPLDPGDTINDQEVPLAGTVGLNNTDHFAYVIGYPDDTVNPLGNITRAEVATIFFRLMTEDFRVANWSTTNSFTDVKEGDWYNNAISTCARAGILKGREDGRFDPKASITRAEFAAIAARFMDDSYTDDGTGDFADTANHWAAKEIRLAAKAGWIYGNGNSFNPEARITRAEVMTIVNRMLDRTPDKDHMLPEMKKWADCPEDAWYYEAVQEATNEHDYTRDETSVETWTALKEGTDWAALELGWAANNGASAPAAETETETQSLPDGI